MYQGKHESNKSVKKLFVIAGNIALATGMPAGVIAAPLVYKTIKNISTDDKTEMDEFTDMCINKVTDIVDGYVQKYQDKQIHNIETSRRDSRGEFINGVSDRDVVKYQGEYTPHQATWYTGVSKADFARYNLDERKEEYLKMVRELEEEEKSKSHGIR